MSESLMNSLMRPLHSKKGQVRTLPTSLWMRSGRASK